MSGNAVFGYGSLILPNSIVTRLDEDLNREKQEFVEKRDYERSQRYLDFYSQEKLDQLAEESELNFVPVKIHGFERYYCLERGPGGNQLAAFPDEDSYINGVIVYPVTDPEFEELADTEEGYDIEYVEKSRIEPYVEADLPEQVAVFVGSEDSPEVNMDTVETRDSTYQKFIDTGVEKIAEIWFDTTDSREDFINEFMADFNRTTYEKHEDEWKRISDIE